MTKSFRFSIIYWSRFTRLRGLSSAGRASALQAEGHRFEPCRPHSSVRSAFYTQPGSEFFFRQCLFKSCFGEIAQLARAHGSYPWCRGFKSPSRYEGAGTFFRRFVSALFSIFYTAKCLFGQKIMHRLFSKFGQSKDMAGRKFLFQGK